MPRTLAERHITKLNVARRRPRSVTICTCEAVVPRELEVIGGAYPHGGRTLSLREGASSRSHRGAAAAAAAAAGIHRKASRAKSDCSCLSFPAQTRVRRPPMVRKSRKKEKRRTLPCPHAGCNMHEHDKTGLVRCVFPCLLMQLITPTDARLVWEKATQGTHRPHPSFLSSRLFSCPIRMEYARNWRRRTRLRNSSCWFSRRSGGVCH